MELGMYEEEPDMLGRKEEVLGGLTILGDKLDVDELAEAVLTEE